MNHELHLSYTDRAGIEKALEEGGGRLVTDNDLEYLGNIAFFPMVTMTMQNALDKFKRLELEPGDPDYVSEEEIIREIVSPAEHFGVNLEKHPKIEKVRALFRYWAERGRLNPTEEDDMVFTYHVEQCILRIHQETRAEAYTHWHLAEIVQRDPRYFAQAIGVINSIERDAELERMLKE
ncbi:MAG: hypothetical protein ACE5FT_05950 [Candidatus Nanoarchaeia archaeon]